MTAFGHDPCRAVYEALEVAGCDPTGPTFKATARCPAHEDRTPSLTLGIGADGQALVHCFAGCSPDSILERLGLTWPDLFPAGHDRARPVPGIAPARRPSDLVLATFRELGIQYRATANPRFWVASPCPACGADGERHPLWVHEDDRGRVSLSCFNGCSQATVLAVLAGVVDGDA